MSPILGQTLLKRRSSVVLPPIPSPVRVFATDYYAFFDDTSGNAGGAGGRGDDVDIYTNTDPGGNGLNIGAITAGEYLVYQVIVPTTGQWRVSVRVASAGGGGPVNIRVGATNYGSTSIPNTGGWNTWQTLTTAANRLEAGRYDIVVYAGGGSFNFGWLELSCDSTEATSQPSSLPSPVRVEAEDFVAASDTDRTTNNGGAYRAANTAANPFGVDITTGGTGFVTGWNNTGEWLTYQLVAPATGWYDLTIRSSNQAGVNGQLGVSIDGAGIASTTIPQTADWNTFQSTSIAGVFLARGAHVLRLDWLAGGPNLDYVEFTCTALSSSTLEQETENWRARVTAAGGTVTGAIAALDTYVKACKTAGIWTRLSTNGLILPFATDGFAGLFEPLVAPAGVSPTNVNFVSGDYSLSTGLSSSSGKYINTGYVPSTYLSGQSCQISLYRRDNVGRAGWLVGSSTSQLFYLYANGGANYIADIVDIGAGRQNIVASRIVGLFSASSTNSSYVFYENGASLASKSPITGSLPNIPVFVFANNSNGTPSATSIIASYVYIGSGLIASEEAAHNTAVQALQTALGRNV